MLIAAPPWDFTLIFAALAILLPWRGAVRIRKLMARPSLSPSDRFATYASTIAFQWIAVGIVGWRVHSHAWNLPSLGILMPNPAKDILTGVVVASVLGFTQFFSLQVLARTPAAHRGIPYQMLRKLMPQSAPEIIPFLGLVATVSLCEEFLYRGFVFAALLLVFRGSVLDAIVGSSALFAIGHLYQGRPGVIMTFLLGLMFASMRVWTGSLVPCVIAHFVIDSVAGIAGPQFLQRADRLAPAPAAGNDGPQNNQNILTN